MEGETGAGVLYMYMNVFVYAIAATSFVQSRGSLLTVNFVVKLIPPTKCNTAKAVLSIDTPAA